MKLILMSHSSDPNFDGDCDYAVVDLTPALVEQIHSRVALARHAGQQDADLCELSFWGSTAEFFDAKLLEACEEAVAAATPSEDADQAAQDWTTELEQNGHAMVPPGVNFGAHEPQRTEVDQLVVRCSMYAQPPRFEIAWTASPKHSDITVTTSELSLAALESYLGKHERAPA